MDLDFNTSCIFSAWVDMWEPTALTAAFCSTEGDKMSLRLTRPTDGLSFDMLHALSARSDLGTFTQSRHRTDLNLIVIKVNESCSLICKHYILTTKTDISLIASGEVRSLQIKTSCYKY